MVWNNLIFCGYVSETAQWLPGVNRYWFVLAYDVCVWWSWKSFNEADFFIVIQGCEKLPQNTAVRGLVTSIVIAWWKSSYLPQ